MEITQRAHNWSFFYVLLAEFVDKLFCRSSVPADDAGWVGCPRGGPQGSSQRSQRQGQEENNLKGVCHEIFLTFIFSSVKPIWATEKWVEIIYFFAEIFEFVTGGRIIDNLQISRWRSRLGGWRRRRLRWVWGWRGRKRPRNRGSGRGCSYRIRWKMLTQPVILHSTH